MGCRLRNVENRVALSLLIVGVVGCDSDGSNDAEAPDPLANAEFVFTAVTFNSGTTEGLRHDDPPDDGYTSEDAVTSDLHYGDGLSWQVAIDATQTLFERLSPDVVAFQEIFGGDCASIPPEARAGFHCDGHQPGDPTVIEQVLGPDYQVACNLGKPDKCAAVHRRFGTFRGCEEAVCLDGLDGAPVDDCGSGSRVGRGVIDLVVGGSITVVNFHGTSGVDAESQACRVAQIDQVFVDLDGAPAASGSANLVLGDFNTDPVRFGDGDVSALRLLDFAGPERPFGFITEADVFAEPTYAGIFNIDHVLSDAFVGTCEAETVFDAIYFDHVPIVCRVGGDAP